MEQQGAKFEGWAVVELFGHQKEFGYVTTQYFGGTAMFQIDVPGLEERDITISRPQYVDGQWTPAGSVVKKSAVAARTRLVGPGAVYSLNPCAEEVVRKMTDECSRDIAVVKLSETRQLVSASLPGEEHDDDIDEGDNE